MTFSGWSSEAMEFFDGLEADNSKTYWNAHRAVYDELVRPPMVELLAELEPEFGEGRILRPYRDTRFSADKSPYKTRIGAMLDGGGYIQLSADGLAAGCGLYLMAPEQLTRYRRAVDDDRGGTQLVRLAAAIEAKGIYVGGRESLKTAPRGYAKDHPRIALLRNKGLIAWLEWPIEPWLATAEAKTRVADLLRTAHPLTEWLDTWVSGMR